VCIRRPSRRYSAGNTTSNTASADEKKPARAGFSLRLSLSLSGRIHPGAGALV
jgi:hypothetical protein